VIKALSVVIPGGGRIAAGSKTLEVRRWAPPLGPTEDLLIVENGRFLRAEGDEDPQGRAVALVRVAGCRPFTREDIPAACAGGFEEGWLAWALTDIRPILPATRCRAARGIYLVDRDPSWPG
jgi:hypothetical protein